MEQDSLILDEENHRERGNEITEDLGKDPRLLMLPPSGDAKSTKDQHPLARVSKLGNQQIDSDLREKYATALNELQAKKYELTQAERRLGHMHSVLVRELGSEQLVVDALSDRTGDGWVGRADEISELKKRIRALQSASGNQSVSIVVDNRRTNELESIVEKQKLELAGIHKQKMALKARVDTLESRLCEYKNDVTLLLEKNDLNNQVIAQLQKCMKNSI